MFGHNRNIAPNWGYFLSSVLKSFNICMIRSENDLKKRMRRLLGK